MALCNGDAVILRHPKSDKDTLCVVSGVSKGNQTQPFYVKFAVATDSRRKSEREEMLCASWNAWEKLTPSPQTLLQFGAIAGWKGPAKINVTPLGKLEKSNG